MLLKASSTITTTQHNSPNRRKRETGQYCTGGLARKVGLLFVIPNQRPERRNQKGTRRRICGVKESERLSLRMGKGRGPS